MENDMLNKTGVYKIVNKVNGKAYYGSAEQSFHIRWSEHRLDLKKNEHHCSHLQHAYNKYGVDNFEYQIILLCDPKDCAYYEQQFLDKYWDGGDNCYNSAKFVRAGMKGLKHTEEAKEKVRKAQMGNKNGVGKGKKLTFNGITLTTPQWAEKIGINTDTIGMRLLTGWSIEEALTTPLQISQHILSFNGETLSLTEWSKKIGICPSTLLARIKNGWPVEKAFTTKSQMAPKYLTFNGETLTLQEWSKKVNISVSVLQGRISNDWKIERILTTPKRKRKKVTKDICPSIPDNNR